MFAHINNLTAYFTVLAIISAIVIGLFLIVMFLIERRRKSQAIPGIPVEGINICDSAINNEMRVMVLERITNVLISNTDIKNIQKLNMDAIRAEALEDLQNRYPDLGIEMVKKD